MRRIARFSRNKDGAALIEFALIGPIFLFLLIALFETALVFLASALLEGGIREASRFGITGRTDLGARDAVIQRVIEDNSVGLLNANDIEVTSEVFESFDDIGLVEEFDDANGNGLRDPGENFTDTNGNGRYDNGEGVPGVGGPQDIVLYSVTYDWQLITPFLRPLVPPDGIIVLQARTAVRNEPFPQP